MHTLVSPFAKFAAASAEGDFLRAMEEAREEFAEARARTGTTEDAVREVMGRIEREEATLEAMERNFGDGGGEQDGGDETGGGGSRGMTHPRSGEGGGVPIEGAAGSRGCL